MVKPTKQTKGRQKVEMVRMEKDSNRLVTFSKRRSGLFKKASELCTLTGADAVIVVFSPGKKAFSFGHPSVDALINRYLGANLSAANDDETQPSDQDDSDEALLKANQQITLLNSQLEMERKFHEELINSRKENTKKDSISWWLPLIDELQAPELKQLLKPILELREKLVTFEKNQHIKDEPKDMDDCVTPLAQNLNEYPPPTGNSPAVMSNPFQMGTCSYHFDGYNMQLPFESPEPSLNLGMNPKSFTSLLMEPSPVKVPTQVPDQDNWLAFKLGL